MIYKTDYHIHTTFSDGKAAPEEYLKAAESAGLSEIGFSEHIALFAENKDWCMDPGNTENYLTYLKTLKEKSVKIKVRSALEVDYYPGKEKELEEFLSRFELDYRIGSVHYLGEMSVDNGPEFYEGKNVDRLYENYFASVIEAVSSGLFDIIAHCDLIRIFGYKPSYDPEYLYAELASKMRSCNVTFEVNTNGRNRPLGDFYPDRRFLKIFRQKGVAVCVNSDAHMPSRVAQHFDEAYQLLREAGYTEMATFKGRVRKMKKLE
jgi:histidinol-phosphatase (PHP family)